MRKNRELAKNVWYEVETAVNSGEPLFRLDFAVVLFYRALREARGRFAFEMRGLAFDGEAGGDASIQRGGFYAAAPWRGGFEQRPQCFGRGCWVGSRVAGFLRPHRGAGG
jgi:hypothetical protein